MREAPGVGEAVHVLTVPEDRGEHLLEGVVDWTEHHRGRGRRRPFESMGVAEECRSPSPPSNSTLWSCDGSNSWSSLFPRRRNPHSGNPVFLAKNKNSCGRLRIL